MVQVQYYGSTGTDGQLYGTRARYPGTGSTGTVLRSSQRTPTVDAFFASIASQYAIGIL